MVAAFARDGYCRFSADPGLLAWARAARAPSDTALRDPALRAKWLTCDGTWFVGVDALPNGPDGALDGVPLTGAAIDFAQSLHGPLPLHRAQLSVVWPGYPRPRAGESDAAFRYRRTRDAAHIDGIRGIGPRKRRHLDELHGWILGIALNEAEPGHSPLVVWRGSPAIMRAGLLQALSGAEEQDWPGIDLTEAYQAARRQVFETCPRVELSLKPGEASLMHRLCLHGVAPWQGGASPQGRRIAYFRPALAVGPGPWLRQA